MSDQADYGTVSKLKSGTPLPLTMIHRMQDLIVQLAAYDLTEEPPADALHLLRLEAASIRRAIEAEYEASVTDTAAGDARPESVTSTNRR